MKRSWRALAFAGIALSAVACGLVLNLPDPTVDDKFGQDGYFPEGYAPIDNYVPPGDVVSVVDSSDVVTPPVDAGPCNCFGGACTDAGVCVPFVIYKKTGEDPNLIDNDNTYVYYAAGSSAIMKLDPKTDAGPLTLSQSTNDFINDLHVSGTNLYFTSLFGSVSHGVFRCPTTGCQDGGARQAYVSGSSKTTFGVVVAGSNVYFTYADADGGIYTCPVDGGSPTAALGTNRPGRIATNGSSLAWIVENITPLGASSCLLPGCTSAINENNADIKAVTETSADIYYVDTTHVWKRPVGSSTPKTQVANDTNLVSVRVDSKHVYWLTTTSLSRCLVTDDCTVTTNIQVLATGLSSAYGLTLSSDSAYFTTRGDHSVWRMGK